MSEAIKISDHLTFDKVTKHYQLEIPNGSHIEVGAVEKTYIPDTNIVLVLTPYVRIDEVNVDVWTERKEEAEAKLAEVASTPKEAEPK